MSWHRYQPLAVRLWGRVDTNGPIPAHRPELGPCWLWTGGGDWDGYGVIKEGGRQQRTHRVAWEMAFGPIPAGMQVLHKCDTPACVRNDGEQSHLFLGTNADNNADMVAKGRQARGERQAFRLHPGSAPRGERNHNAKLTADQVRRMRELYSAGGHRPAELARAFGITDTQVIRIVRGQFWRHVPMVGMEQPA